MLQHPYTETTRSMPRGGVVLPAIERAHDLSVSGTGFEWNKQLGRRRD